MDTSFLTWVNGQLEKPSSQETQQLSTVQMGWKINYSWGKFLRGEAASDPPVTSVSQLSGYPAQGIPSTTLAAGLALEFLPTATI